MLVDIQLPGIDGLELTRRVRQDARNGGMVVVACTASTQADEHHAYEAGCDGFITKPIDTRTLGARLRGFLEGQSAPSPEASTDAPASSSGIPEGLTLTGSEMESLRRGFLRDTAREVRRILEFLDSCSAETLSRLLHQWTGSAGALGYMEAAAEARRAEALLAKPGWRRSELREVLTNLAILLARPPEASDTPIPDRIVEQLTRKRIALVGFPDDDADRVCAALESVRPGECARDALPLWTR
jgi:CheY-like chemotaxis protein